MFKYIKLSIITGVFLTACNTANNKPLSIHFSADSTKIIILGIAPAGLYEVKKGLQSDSAYQQLVSVLQTPADDDSVSIENKFPGKLTVTADSLIFIPNHPFIKGKSYLVQTIVNTQFASANDIIKNNVGHKVKPQQQVLKR